MRDMSTAIIIKEEAIAFCCEYLMRGWKWPTIMKKLLNRSRKGALSAYATNEEIRRHIPTQDELRELVETVATAV